MSFFETPARRLCLVRAWGLFAIALIMGLLPLFLDVDGEGYLYCFGGASFCLLLGLVNLWQARRTPPEDILTDIPDRAPIPEQIRYYRKALALFATVFPAMSVWTAYDLRQFESGATTHVALWGPLVTIYEHFGYWPTVLSLLFLGIAGSALTLIKIRKLRTHLLAAITTESPRTKSSVGAGIFIERPFLEFIQAP